MFPYKFRAEPRRLSLEPDRIVGRGRHFMPHPLEVFPVPVPRERRHRHDKRHNRSEKTVLHGVTVFVIFDMHARTGILEEENPEGHSAPVPVAVFEIPAAAPFFRTVSAQKMDPRPDASGKGGGKSPGEREKIKSGFGHGSTAVLLKYDYLQYNIKSGEIAENHGMFTKLIQTLPELLRTVRFHAGFLSVTAIPGTLPYRFRRRLYFSSQTSAGSAAER